MPELLQTILSDPLTYIGILVVGFGKLWMDRRITAAVDTRFAERLETHKHELTIAAEAVRFDHQRRMTDIGLYANRKHAAAAEIYGKFREAHGALANYGGISTGLTFQEYNDADLTSYMTRREVPLGMQATIITEIRRDRVSGVKMLRGYLRMLDLQEANRAFQTAKNVTYLNELYLSDAAIEAIDRLVGIMGELLTYYEVPPDPGEKLERPTRKDLDAALEAVHGALRRELAGEQATTTIELPAPKPE